MNDNAATIPTCPGCHFGCTLEDFQCARGERFAEKWKAGEEIPVRRPPWEREGGKGHGKHADPHDGEPDSPSAESASRPTHIPPPRLANLPVSARLMMLLTLAQNVLADRDDEQRDRRVAECILRQDGSATNRIIAERTHLADAEIDEQIESLSALGLVTSRTLDGDRVFHDLTDAGRAQVETWFDEHKAADAAFFEALTDEEADQLEALLAKALGPHMRRGPRPKR